VLKASDLRGALFQSDGTRWRPLNGRALIAMLAGSVSNPVAALTSAGAAQTFALPGGSIRIPAGLLIPGSSMLRVSAYWSKTGAAAGINCVTAIGTTNSLATDSQTTNQFIGAAATAAWNQQCDYSVQAAGVLCSNDLVATNAAAGATAAREFTFNINTAADMFINFGQTSSSSGDGLKLCWVSVELFQ
jgi:hypothetical protein